MAESKTDKRRRRRRPGLKLIMLLTGLFILAMPVSWLYLFRIYENELVRQTESELISQAAVVAAIFKNEMLRLGGPAHGRKLSGYRPVPDGGLNIVTPHLDLSRAEVHPRRLDFRVSPYPPDPAALEAGRKLQAVLTEAQRTTLSYIYVVDNHGLVVAGPTGQGLSMADNLEVSEALNGHYYSLLRERPPEKRAPLSSIERRGARFRVFFALPVMNGDRLLGAVQISRTPREIIKALYKEEKRNLIWAAILSLGLVILISFMVKSTIITPVRRLAEESTAISEGRSRGLAAKAPYIVVRELAELREVVGDMAERLRHRSDYLKAFASGVSHEFKTPLTSIKGAMELLGEHGREMDEATRSRFENNIRADLERLERLVGRLLTLARAEAKAEESGSGEEVEAVELLKRLAGHYRDLGYTVEINGPADLKLAASPDVLETVIRNLLDNSRDAGASLSRVELSLDQSRRDGLICLEDDGPGIPAELAESIFSPFFTTRKNEGGTGLGLSLARTLLTPFRGELQLLESEQGAAFAIILPLARKTRGRREE